MHLLLQGFDVGFLLLHGGFLGFHLRLQLLKLLFLRGRKLTDLGLQQVDLLRQGGNVLIFVGQQFIFGNQQMGLLTNFQGI